MAAEVVAFLRARQLGWALAAPVRRIAAYRRTRNVGKSEPEPRRRKPIDCTRVDLPHTEAFASKFRPSFWSEGQELRPTGGRK